MGGIIKNKKAQVATEFMMVVGLSMIIIIVFVGLMYSMIYSYSEDKNLERILDFGYSLQNEIILASQVEGGYERPITLPSRINRIVYNVNIVNNDLILIYDGTEILFPLPETTGDFNPGANCTITRGVNDNHVDVSC